MLHLWTAGKHRHQAATQHDFRGKKQTLTTAAFTDCVILHCWWGLHSLLHYWTFPFHTQWAYFHSWVVCRSVRLSSVPVCLNPPVSPPHSKVTVKLFKYRSAGRWEHDSPTHRFMYNSSFSTKIQSILSFIPLSQWRRCTWSYYIHISAKYEVYSSSTYFYLYFYKYS